MSSIRQSNRACKSKVYWKLSSFTCRWWQSAFIIHADFSEDQLTLKNLDMQFSENLDTQFSENLNMKFKNLNMKFKNLNMKSENLNMKSEDLDMKSEHLDMQSAEN